VAPACSFEVFAGLALAQMVAASSSPNGGQISNARVTHKMRPCAGGRVDFARRTSGKLALPRRYGLPLEGSAAMSIGSCESAAEGSG